MLMLMVVVKRLSTMTTTTHQGYCWHYGKWTDEAGLEEAVARATEALARHHHADTPQPLPHRRPSRVGDAFQPHNPDSQQSAAAPPGTGP